jgi:hypothetical protein
MIISIRDRIVGYSDHEEEFGLKIAIENLIGDGLVP